MTGNDVDDLLRATAGGSTRSFSLLYDEMSPRLFGLILGLVRSRAISEEVLQDVMLEVWDRADRFDGERGSGVGWLFRIARSRAIDRIRSVESDDARSEAVGAGYLEDVAGPEDLLADRAEAGELHRALTQLTPMQSEAIELTYFEGLTHSEAAERLGVPMGTLKSRVHEALLRLRTVLRRSADGVVETAPIPVVTESIGAVAPADPVAVPSLRRAATLAASTTRLRPAA